MRFEKLSVFLDLEDRRVLVIGGGKIALEKLRSLTRTGAEIHVVAIDFSTDCLAFVLEHELKFEKRPFRSSDLTKTFIVYVATSDREFNHAVAADARRQNILVNVVDDPAGCDFFSASIVRRGPIQIAISTGGQHPALAKAMRKHLEETLPSTLGLRAEELVQMRAEFKKTISDPTERRERILATLRVFEKENFDQLKTPTSTPFSEDALD